jgi:hypothetical protein
LLEVEHCICWSLGIIQAFEVYYHSELLGVVKSELQIVRFIMTLMLKDVAYNVRLAWTKVVPTTIANLWEKCVGKDDVIKDEVKLIPFPKQDMKAACDAFGSNWEADAEMLIMQYFSEKDVKAFV